MDYSVYKPAVLEYIGLIVVAAVGTGIVSYLFYDSLWGIILCPLTFWIVRKVYLKKKIKEQVDKLLEEFMDMLKSISAALLAGYSMENAWKEAQKEAGLLHGSSSLIYKELEEMNQKIAMNIPVEKAMNEFAERTGIEDITNFAEIFSFAKRSGGDYVGIIDNTTYRICSKYETEKEIEVTIASKKLEQKVMDAIPLFILAYLKISSRDYMEVLYGNVVGVIFMTVCIAAYAGAIVLSEKIMDIRI